MKTLSTVLGVILIFLGIFSIKIDLEKPIDKNNNSVLQCKQ